MMRVALAADKDGRRVILWRGVLTAGVMVAMIISLSAAAMSYALLKELSLRMILPPVVIGTIVVVGGAAYRSVHSPPEQQS